MTNIRHLEHILTGSGRRHDMSNDSKLVVTAVLHGRDCDKWRALCAQHGDDHTAALLSLLNPDRPYRRARFHRAPVSDAFRSCASEATLVMLSILFHVSRHSAFDFCKRYSVERRRERKGRMNTEKATEREGVIQVFLEKWRPIVEAASCDFPWPLRQE